MKVNLVGSTQPRIIGIDNLEDFIAYCAKVSNPQFQDDFTNSKKLLSYLMKHKHWSPFEMASITLEIETTRDIARQILRHRSFSFQEFSQRYKEVDAIDNPYVTRDARYQDNKNRQDSIELNLSRPFDRDLNKAWHAKQSQLLHETKLAYKWALDWHCERSCKGYSTRRQHSVSPLYAGECAFLDTLYRTTIWQWNTERAYACST